MAGYLSNSPLPLTRAHDVVIPAQINKAPHNRLYRDCASADLAFTAFLTLLAALTARAFCEQPDLALLLAFLSALLAHFSASARSSTPPSSHWRASSRSP
ncbi:hypothetical protein B0H16DRAFT_1720819 [Mycena metata]|uniref:Uncharacterized protein n=1 Tax=Mycena metata TaxID=1033252 RepID=A0AAD7NFL8_9AGAR|nr:hypothetical protein B0H16DRAFT_1720819 [Mycena metata]